MNAAAKIWGRCVILGDGAERVDAVGFEAYGDKNDRHDRDAASDIGCGGEGAGICGRERVEAAYDAEQEAAAPRLEDAGEITSVERVQDGAEGM